MAVAPLFVARGVQNKVLEAVAAGLPCVVTTAVLDGLPGQVLPGCVAATDAAGFAAAVLGVLDLAPAQRRAMADRADLRSLSWDSQMASLIPILDAVVRRDGRRRDGGSLRQMAG